MEAYKDPNFKIEEVPCFNNTDGYKELSMYLDFACKTTIQRQFPGISSEQEIPYAKEILMKYMNGDKSTFTRQFAIRGNIEKIGPERIRGILIANMIERDAFNQGNLNKLEVFSVEDQSARDITHMTLLGQLEEPSNHAWINQNIGTLINCYVDMKYNGGLDRRNIYEYYTNNVPTTQKAMEMLNLEMKLNSYRK